MRPCLMALTTAVPPYVFDQKDVAKRTENLLSGNKKIQRMLPVFENAGINRRYSCVPIDWHAAPHGWKERNELYVRHAVSLLEDVVHELLDTAKLQRDDIDAIVTVSTTRVATPSPDALLIEMVGLRSDTRRLPVFGLGCAGGVIGLARAASPSVARLSNAASFAPQLPVHRRFAPGHRKKGIGRTRFARPGAAVARRPDFSHIPSVPRPYPGEIFKSCRDAKSIVTH